MKLHWSALLLASAVEGTRRREDSAASSPSLGSDRRLQNNGGCFDRIAQCESWASSGECEQNPGYMNSNCARACNTCDAEPASQATTEPSARPTATPTATPTPKTTHTSEVAAIKKECIHEQMELWKSNMNVSWENTSWANSSFGAANGAANSFSHRQ